MTFEITDQGIRYTIPNQTIAEDLATDRIEDAALPITQAEIKATLERVHQYVASIGVEAVSCDCAAQGAPTKCGACGR